MKKRRLEPLRKIGARMKKARLENDAVEIDEPVNMVTTEEKNSEPTANTIIATPEYIPPKEQNNFKPKRCNGHSAVTWCSIGRR